VAVLLSYLTKAPLVPEGTPVINALNKQRSMLENVMRACIGLGPESNMLLECGCVCCRACMGLGPGSITCS